MQIQILWSSNQPISSCHNNTRAHLWRAFHNSKGNWSHHFCTLKSGSLRGILMAKVFRLSSFPAKLIFQCKRLKVIIISLVKHNKELSWSYFIFLCAQGFESVNFPTQVFELGLITPVRVCEKDSAREYEMYKKSSQAALDVYNRREVGCVCA